MTTNPNDLLESLMASLPDDDPNETVIIGGTPKIKAGGNELTWEDPDDDLPQNQQQSMSRLVYLIVTYRIKIPWQIARVLPFSNHLKNLHEGLGAVADIDELSPLYELGGSYGEGSVKEAVMLILRLAEPLMSASTTSLIDRFQIYQQVIAMNVDPIGDTDFVDINLETAEHEKIDYWQSGFTPMDHIMYYPKYGFYNALVVLIGNPGIGKTSFLLTFMEQLVKQGVKVTYYENEIPAKMMGPKITPLVQRTLEMKEHGRVTCGPWTSSKILADVQANPDPDRVIIFDTPDVVLDGEGGDNRRFDMEAAYIDMIRVKALSKAVFVASQPRRSEDGHFSMKSVAESWQKAWYADVIIGLNQLNDSGTIMPMVVKNRFGPCFGNETITYDHQQMTWDLIGGDIDADWAAESKKDW